LTDKYIPDMMEISYFYGGICMKMAQKDMMGVLTAGLVVLALAAGCSRQGKTAYMVGFAG
jgi:hypothetical protein